MITKKQILLALYNLTKDVLQKETTHYEAENLYHDLLIYDENLPDEDGALGEALDVLEKANLLYYYEDTVLLGNKNTVRKLRHEAFEQLQNTHYNTPDTVIAQEYSKAI